MKKNNNRSPGLIFYLVLALTLRLLAVDQFLEKTWPAWLKMATILVIFVVGIGYVFRGTAKVIEEATDVLQERTKLAGGLLQALGTAFPDMIIGVMAALISLQVKAVDYLRAINLAIVAASTTFGSNIYNILHASWCLYRQNLANRKHRAVPMFPFMKIGGDLQPLEEHRLKPTIREIDEAIRILTILTLLTSFTALSMVLFGRVEGLGGKIEGDLYQLIPPVGFVLFNLCLATFYFFRKSQRYHLLSDDEAREESHYYSRQSSWRIWADLILAGVAILFVAESLVRALEAFSLLTRIPFVVTGVAAGLIGCFGEMMVVHNFSVHPRGRIGDAIVGVAMDNIVTIMGAAIVAMIGGIFLGSNSLILIFVVILMTNTILIEQISRFKNDLFLLR